MVTSQATAARTTAPNRAAIAERVPPETYFAVSAVFHYLGPAFAVLLFARIDVLGVAWLRIAAAAALFAIWRRPWRTLADADREGRRLLIGWGLILALMNTCFYLAIDRLALGTVGAIEFLPVIIIAAVGMRTPRNLAALAIAVTGVYLLTDVELQAEPFGVALAVGNAALFAIYIVIAHRISQHREIDGIDGLAAAMVVALIFITPIGGLQASAALLDPVALAAGIGVGICSSVIPYVTDQLAMRRLARSTYALLVALLPAVATVVGLVVLQQVPMALEVVGVSAVVAAVALHRERPAPGGS